MSNPNVPIVPMGAAPINQHRADDEDALPIPNPDADNDELVEEDEATLDEDLREGDTVNQNLSE